MVPDSDKKLGCEIQEETAQSVNGCGSKDHCSLDVETCQMEITGNSDKRRSKFLDFICNFRGTKFVKLAPSPSVKFRQFASKRDEFSRSVRSEQSEEKHFYVSFIRKIDWASLWAMSKDWIRNPMNLALFVWIVGVAISGALLFLVMTGMLNAVIPKKSQRDIWFEVNNQILNALFTLMCLYQHPKRLYHLVLLLRWEPKDIIALRKVYCKNATYKPNEWMHMMVMIFLLNVNCFAQYALCGLNLGLPRSRRPAIGVGLCISVAICAPAFASVYNIISPLGKDYETGADEEATSEIVRIKSFEKKYSFVQRENQRIAECKPEWVGGLLDFWDDISLAYLSVFCSCCVFGWNMERLGFGNMYVHIMTFLLFCLAPFFIFNLAAVNINNEAVREALGISGILLSLLGLLYGGFWRIQMRKKFKLPGNSFCCGKPSVTDCFQWLCCCSCSLAQEVRTADYYKIVEDKLYATSMADSREPTTPLPLEDGSPFFASTLNSPRGIFKMEYQVTPRKSGCQTPDMHFPGMDDTMRPPVPSLIQNEDNSAAVLTDHHDMVRTDYDGAK